MRTRRSKATTLNIRGETSFSRSSSQMSLLTSSACDENRAHECFYTFFYIQGPWAVRIVVGLFRTFELGLRRQKKIEGYKSKFLNVIAGGRAAFTEEEFAMLKQFVEQKDRATAPAAAAPMENAPAPSTSIGMFMPSTVPELRGREKLRTFLQRFRTWACVRP